MEKSRKADKITRFNTWYSQDIKSYKKFAENRSRATRYTQEYLTELTYRIKDYLSQRDAAKQPFTVTGLFMSLEMQKKDYYKARNGEFDWKLYQFADFKGLSCEDLENLEQIEDEQLGLLRIWTDEDGQVFIMETYSTIIEKALLVLQDRLEQRLYTNTKNPVGIIFILKSRFGWCDKPEQRVSKTIISHIASKEEAKKALQDLQE